MILGLLIRFTLAGVFLLSGAIKLKDPGAFFLDVQAFALLPAPWDFAVALTLPCLEVFLGLALLLKLRLRGAGAWVIALSTSFIGALLYADNKGIDLQCGCFGDYFVFPNLTTHLIFNGFLFVCGLWIWAVSRPLASKG